jgi:hypothetical protein
MSEIIDSRDLIKEIDDLEAMEDHELTADDRERLAELRVVAESGIEDWIYGATLIREDYFVTYAQDLAEDIGAIGRDMQWPLSHIDWEAAADALKVDYTEVELGGHTYYVRA